MFVSLHVHPSHSKAQKTLKWTKDQAHSVFINNASSLMAQTFKFTFIALWSTEVSSSFTNA